MFKFLGAQLAQLSKEEANKLAPLQTHLFDFVFRELSGRSRATQPDSDSTLANLTHELAAMLKQKLGATEFTRLLADFQLSAARKKAEKKRERDETHIRQPELAAKLKQKATLKKSAAKKRKLDTLRPHRVVKRKRREEIHRTGEL